nr:ATPase subunit 9, mitochondrial [Tanacetum cinerariifolium]
MEFDVPGLVGWLPEGLSDPINCSLSATALWDAKKLRHPSLVASPFFIEIGWCSVYRLCSLYEASEYKIEKNALHGKKKREENYQLKMLEFAKLIGVGAATIASARAAIGIRNVLSSSIHSVVRNPSLAKQSFGYAILGFALTEAIASFAPMMAFLISSVFLSKNQRKKVSVS